MKIFNLIIIKEKELINDIEDLCNKVKTICDKSAWSAINPIIHSLKELRKNTWDKERVDTAIQWLKDNFEVEDEE